MISYRHSATCWLQEITCFTCFVALSALSRLRNLYLVGAWCSDPGTHVLSFCFVSGFGHSRSVFCHCESARTRVRSNARSPVRFCFVVLHTVRVSIGCVYSCYILCCVARSLCISLVACFHVVMSCVNTWLMSFLISCMRVHVLFCTWLVILFAGHVLVFCFV